MAKNYLRVTQDWMEILTPRDIEIYLSNISGTSIEILISDNYWNLLGRPHDRPFTIGGIISEMLALKSNYVYARAVSNTPGKDGVLTTDDKQYDPSTEGTLRKDLDELTVEVMRLAKRISLEELKSVDMDANFILFVRRFLIHQGNTQADLATLDNEILKLNSRLFTAEIFIQNFRNEYNDYKYALDEAIFGTEGSVGQVGRLFEQVDDMLKMINNINIELDQLQDQFDQLTEGELEIIVPSIEKLQTDFAYLNNAMVRFSKENTVSDINEVFYEIINQASAEMRDPVTALRDILSNLATAITDDDSVVFGPNIDLLRKL